MKKIKILIPILSLILLSLLIFSNRSSSVVRAADGTVPNQSYLASELYTQISPVMSNRHHNQPYVINGYLFLAGNGIHEIWDISDPYNPSLISEMFSPHRFGEAESHQASFARYPNGSGGYNIYAATTSGRGIDLWDITNAASPQLLNAMLLEGVNYGDNTAAVWGIAWQGNYIYVGGTNTGLHIVDATNPANPSLVQRMPNAEFGGMSAGPLFAVGNLLVITTPKNSSALSTLDISDPANPVLLDFENPSPNSYIGGFFGGHAYLQSPFQTYDVTTDPSNITLLGSDSTPSSEYMSFGNGHLFLGTLRTSAGGLSGVLKYDISDPNNLVQLAHIVGRPNAGTDDQFSVPIGNLLVISDDENLFGSWLSPHETAPDTVAPQVSYVNPADGATNIATTGRIGLSFDDQIELTSVDENSLIVRPIGGQPISGKWGYEHTVISFWPDQPLQASTTYEIVAPAGGIKDLVGNSLAAQFRSTFTTSTGSPLGICALSPLSPVQVGQSAAFAALNVDETTYNYSWDFGDSSTANGATANHTYSSVGRYPVILSVTENNPPAGSLVLEGENGTLSGGIVVATNHPGYLGTGFADYPTTTGTNVKITWQVDVSSAGSYDVDIRYANGSSATRPLRLYVNGSAIQVVNFGNLANWDTWGVETVTSVAFNQGNNTIELVADAGSIGPNIDRLTINGLSATPETDTCSATQIVHRALTSNSPTRSSAVLVDEGNNLVWAVNPDTNTVTAVNSQTLNKAFEVATGTDPRTLAQAPNGSIWVVNRGSANITIHNATSGAQTGSINLPYASQPFGIAFAPDGSAAYVTLEGLGQLLEINPSTQAIVATLSFPDANGIDPKVRGIAITHDSSQALVTRFISPDGHGEIFDVNLSNLTLQGTFNLANDPGPDTPDSGRGIPNYINSIAISPDGIKAWIPSKKDNMDRGTFRDGQALTQDSAVRPIISQIDLNTDLEDLSARMDLNDSDMPFAAAVSSYGDLVFVVLQGTNTVDVRNAYNGEPVSGFPTEFAPQGLALDSNGRLYVQNFMSRSLSVFDVSTILSGADNTAQELATVNLIANETLSAQVLQGKQIFYDASSRKMNLEGYLSCATCHLDGDSDGRVWDFTDRGEGLRNTTTLNGRAGTGHGNVHWTANFDEIQDFENDIRNHFGGIGFLSDTDFNNTSDPLGNPKAGLNAELDALAAYVTSLATVPDSPYRNPDGSLTADGVAGKQLFENLNCQSCHVGANFTDNQRHDVGTIQSSSGQGIGQPLAGVGFDTPTLKGLWADPPYLHNGQAANLAAVLNSAAHGGTNTLTSTERNQLVAYLLQIDENEPGFDPPGGPTPTPSPPPSPTPPPAGNAFQQDSGADGIVSMEAENHDANVSQGGKNWVVVTSPTGFSGASALQAQPNSGTNQNTGYVANSPRLDFEVDFVKTGTHYIWIRGYGASGNDDSLHAGLDSQAISTADRISSFPASYGWSNNTMDTAIATINVTTAGTHTFNLWMREDGFIVDKIVLTTNASYTPSGTGPAESPRGGGSGPTPTPPPTTTPPPPTPTATPSGSPQEFEAEDGTLSGGVVVDNQHAGYSGTGFADYPGTTGPNEKVTWQVNVSSSSNYTFDFRYANGSSTRSLHLKVNGTEVQVVSFPGTGAWTTYQTVTVSGVALNAGNNTIEMVAETAIGPNLDKMTVSP